MTDDNTVIPPLFVPPFPCGQLPIEFKLNLFINSLVFWEDSGLKNWSQLYFVYEPIISFFLLGEQE